MSANGIFFTTGFPVRISGILVVRKISANLSSELGAKEELVTMEARLSEDLGADSIDAVELIMKLEDTFDVSVSDEEAQAMTTVKDIVHYLEQKK